MSKATRAAEAERVEIVYYWAINRLTDHAGSEALKLWAQVPATPQAAKSSWWLAELLKMLFGLRSEAQLLAIAYYRFQRALRTGETIAAPGEQPGSSTTLDALRQEFLAEVDKIEAMTSEGVVTPEPALGLVDDDPIPVVAGPDIDSLIKESDTRALDEATDNLDTLGIQVLLRKLDRLEAELAHAQAGRRSTAAFQRYVMNAARGLIYDVTKHDSASIGWVRYSTTGHPCGWCAMLISRGVVYKSASTALSHDEYHDNCRCIAIPVFSMQQFDSSPLFDQNREYEDLWYELKDTDDAELIKQYGTAELLAIFRIIFRQRAAQPTTALVAA